MNTSFNPDYLSDSSSMDKVRSLILKLENNTIGQDEFQQLDQMVCENDDARAVYVQHMLQTVSLRDWAAEHHQEQAPRSVDNRLQGKIVLRSSSVLGFLTNIPRETKKFFTSQIGLSIAVAMMSITSLLLTLILIHPDSLFSRNAAGMAKEDSANTYTVATITRAIDCTWDQSSGAFKEGDLVTNGELLNLTEGRLVLTFTSGARVTLKAPVQFQAIAAKEANIEFGECVVYVPKRANNFKINSPLINVTDLGTEFAMQVDENKSTLLHVYKGKVRADSLDQNGKTIGSLNLSRGQSAKFSANTTKPEVFIPNEAPKFVRQLKSHDDVRGETYAQAVMDLKPSIYWRFEDGPKEEAITDLGSAKVSIPLGIDGRSRFRTSRYGYYALNSQKGLEPLQINTKPLPSDEFTISCWIKPRSKGGGGRGNIIRLAGAGHLQICTSDGVLSGPKANREIICYQSGGPGNGSFRLSSGIETLVFKKWTHLTFTAKAQPDSKTCQYCIYLNGKLMNSTTVAYNPKSSAYNIMEFATERERNLFYDGLIDEFAFFSHALSEQQNKQLYDSATGQ